MHQFSSHLHSVLPANGAPVVRQRTGRLKELYNDYVRERTLRTWKFWIVSSQATVANWVNWINSIICISAWTDIRAIIEFLQFNCIGGQHG